MSPVNSHERPPRRDLMINGLRPSPLTISKDSHFIQKPSAGVMSQTAAARPKQQQRQGPVIIYTYSPKIIHTQARDFMALVQKLTGFSRSDEVNETAPSRPRKNKAKDNSLSPLEGDINTKLAANRQEDNDSSSALTDENGCFSVAGGDVNNVSSSYVPMTVSPTNPFFADIPLFTPNSAAFFCSPRPVYKFADNAIVSPSLGNSNSPTLLEFMKGLPDY
ncbi:VQ motif-containing protein 8, chloroplastic [Durio zibethinus]|uniref:VQ motif-containing protein 8, chloroplastic n=1 Tax=Durio zibethinus TaxID=66656 RepID=A0A6P5Y271_DURZI|nr:VQ motif-containing protein 8, chloroplastic [Durio zibethinus]